MSDIDLDETTPAGTAEDDDAGWALFKRSVRQVAGIDLDAYKEGQMRRRLGQIKQRRGGGPWAAYARALRDQPAALAEFRDFFTINVSEFFRQPDRYEELRRQHLPALAQSGHPLRIWSAGCSIGAEPYSLAMLATELPRGRVAPILATDIDDTILQRARSGAGYSAADVRHIPPEFRAAYVTANGDTFDLADSIRRMVEFKRHDLLRDPYPQNLDLIVCRNVVIYFTDEAKGAIYTKFFDALRPGGLLFVGGTEIVSGATAIGFTNPAISIYEKKAAGQPKGMGRDTHAA